MGFSPSRRIMPCVGFCLNSFIYGESHTKQNVPYLWVSCLYSHLGLQVGNWDWWPGDWATWLWMCLSLRGTVCYCWWECAPKPVPFETGAPYPHPERPEKHEVKVLEWRSLTLKGGPGWSQSNRPGSGRVRSCQPPMPQSEMELWGPLNHPLTQDEMLCFSFTRFPK